MNQDPRGYRVPLLHLTDLSPEEGGEVSTQDNTQDTARNKSAETAPLPKNPTQTSGNTENTVPTLPDTSQQHTSVASEPAQTPGAKVVTPEVTPKPEEVQVVASEADNTTDIQALLMKAEALQGKDDPFHVDGLPKGAVGESVSPTTAHTAQEKIPVIGDDIPDMWEALNVSHTSPTPSTHDALLPKKTQTIDWNAEEPTIVKSAWGVKTTNVHPQGTPLTTIPANQTSSKPPTLSSLAPDDIKSIPTPESTNLLSLRERVLKEGMYAKGPPSSPVQQVSPAPERMRQGAAILSNNTHEQGEVPDTMHAQAIAETARKLGALSHEHDMQEKKPLGSLAQSQEESQTPHLASIRTFRSDVEETIVNKKTSVVDMLAAEQKHKESTDVEVRAAKESSWSFGSIILFVTAIILVFAAIGLGAYLLLTQQSTIRSMSDGFIATEKTEQFDSTGKNREELMRDLVRARDLLSIRLGFIAEIIITKRTNPSLGNESPVTRVTGKEFFEQLQMGAPPVLTRSLTDNMLFGVHAFNTNQPFVILHTTYRQNAYRGMIEWEERMFSDLAPLFDTSTTYDRTATNERDGTSQKIEGAVVGTFEDMTIANTRSRVYRGPTGAIKLVWCIPDTSTIIITTNENTLKEIRDRMGKQRE